MTKKKNFPNELFNIGGISYTKIFDGVTVGLGTTCSVLLGEIVGYCEMSKENVCTVSQDNLSFSMGISISTCKRSLNKLLQEGMIFSKTRFSHVPQKFSVDNKKIRKFDENYNTCLIKFLEIEREIIKNSSKDKTDKYVVKTEEGLKILRRYINMYYDSPFWYVKITGIENKEYRLTEFEVF